MMGKSHLLQGATAAAWTAIPLSVLGVPPALVLLSIPVGAYSALLADLDHHASMATWSCPPISNFVSWTLRGMPYNVGFLWWGRSGWLLPVELTVSTGHRKEMHTEEAAGIAGLILGLPLWWVPPIGGWWWAFSLQIAVGYLTHLYGDLRTTGGLRHRSGTGRRTIGRTFDVGSPHEHFLRATVYKWTAILSTIGAVVVIALMHQGN
jgi:membrane-bound metal-dependent hydrolase YbcI (DUF457 family)